MGLRSPISSVLLLFIFLFLTYTINAELDKVICAGEPCTINGSPGSAAYLRKCKSVLNAFRNGTPLAVVGYYFFEPIVCCPLNESISTTKESIDPKTIVEQQCKIYKNLLYDVGVYDYVNFPYKSKQPGIVHNNAKSNRYENEMGYPATGGYPAIGPRYNVAIYSGNSTAFENFICGGTLISERYVVTAGHCTYSIDGETATWIRVGVTNINGPGGQSIKIIDRKKHPCYKREPYFTHHDIALLELERNVTIDGVVQLACLPFTSLNITDVTGSGWGENETYGNTLPRLQEVHILIEECDSKAEWKLCSYDTGKGACRGDSGGPLTNFNKEYRMDILVGVVSQGPDCGYGLGTYANVSYYVPWIQSIVWPTEDYNEKEFLKDLKCSYS